jgi:hypothetical protein
MMRLKSEHSKNDAFRPTSLEEMKEYMAEKAKTNKTTNAADSSSEDY